MNTGGSKSLDSGAWRDLCKAVLFEVPLRRFPIFQDADSIARGALGERSPSHLRSEPEPSRWS